MKNRDFTNVGARGRSSKTEPVRKEPAGWTYRAGQTTQWVGFFPTRNAARKARLAHIPSKNETPSSAGTITATSAEASCIPSPVAVSSEKSSESATPVLEEKKIMRITLTKRNTNKGGGTLYTLAGLGGSVRFPKSLFAEGQEPPTSVTIEAPDGSLALPGAVKAKVTSEEQAAKIRANAEKARVRAEKAQNRAAKAAARAAALDAKSAVAASV